MPKTIFFLISSLLSTVCIAQDLLGAWESTKKLDNGIEIKTVMIFTDFNYVRTLYFSETGEFKETSGGSYNLINDLLTEKIEFNTSDSTRVGEEVSYRIDINDDELRIEGNQQDFKRIDSGMPGDLQGAWLMSGRFRNGEKQTRNTDQPRKTMKILSGTRFQWIAYNTETAEFMGTGGGNYTTIDGKYTENIEFFSRDNSRVGASLEFDYDLVEGDWHHKGFSSKGDPLHEIWSKRER